MIKRLFGVVVLAGAIPLAGCGTGLADEALAAGAGAAAVAYYTDENEVCDPPTEAGLLDDDC